MTKLFSEIPYELRAARIGTCYNPLSRTLMVKKIVIDPMKLDQKAIHMVQGNGTFVYQGQRLVLMEYGAEDLFNYMTNEFQKALTDLLNVERADEFIAKYFKFTELFGYGCVTELYLTSGSAFKMDVKYSSKAASDRSKYVGEIPKAPEIPKGNADKKELPKKEAPAVTKELQEKFMKEDGFEGKTWEEYLEAQKSAFEKLKPDTVVNEVCADHNTFLSIDISAADDVYQATEAEVMDELGAAWNLGGYIPYNYTVTPWTELFPQIKALQLPTTFTSIYIAKAFIYYLTRMQCASYLFFLADVGGTICENDAIQMDAAKYAKLCSELLKEITNTITRRNGQFTERDYHQIVAYFEQKLSKLERFYSRSTCWYFFMNYRFFIDNACAFCVFPNWIVAEVIIICPIWMWHPLQCRLTYCEC